MSETNEKVVVMSEIDLSQALTSLLKDQSKRDEVLRKDITIATLDASRALVEISNQGRQLEELFNLHNQTSRDRIQSAKTNWGTILSSVVVASVLMTAILTPIATGVIVNNDAIAALEIIQTDSRIEEADKHARTQMRQAWSEDVLMTIMDYEQRMGRAWIDESKGIAFPNRTYNPLLKGP